jgi:hypothetical protein
MAYEVFYGTEGTYTGEEEASFPMPKRGSKRVRSFKMNLAKKKSKRKTK